MITAVGGATGTSWVEARKLLRVGQCTGRPTEDQGLDVTGVLAENARLKPRTPDFRLVFLLESSGRLRKHAHVCL